MVAIEQCPTTLERRTSRSNINKCPSLENYHCLKTEDGQLRELCTSPIWIEAGKCPIFSATGKLDARICKSSPSLTCPTNVYKSNLNFNYGGCLPSLRPESPTTNINGKYQTTQNSTLTVSGSGEVGSSLVVAIVVPLLVLVIIVTFGIAWWKKKEFRKWIRDFAQNIRKTEPDIESPEAQICLDLPNEIQRKKKRKGASKRRRIVNWRFLKVFRRKNKNLEEDKSLTNNDKFIENQSKLDVEELMEEQEKSNEARSISLQTKDPVPISKDVLAGNIDTKLMNNATKADSRSAQTKEPVYISKDVSVEKIDENKSQETFRERLIERMANLLLDKDVLVLISSLAKETNEFAYAITIKACEHTQGANFRTVYQFNDLRDFVKETLTIVLFIHDNFKEKRSYHGDTYYVNKTLEITQNAMKTKGSNIHTLICLPSKVYKDFEVALKKKSLAFAVYDLSTMQEHETTS